MRKNMTDSNEEMPKEQPPRSLHHRIYPYMDEMVQYATERAEELTDPDARPWIVRDRSTALRNERQGRGKALVRVWIPGDWVYVNEEED
jgi:hypothetical protein